MKGKNLEFEISLLPLSLDAFLESYNKNIPASFPRVSVAMLNEFQIRHPVLFKHGSTWSVAQHRKKVMDWLSSQRSF